MHSPDPSIPTAHADVPQDATADPPPVAEPTAAERHRAHAAQVSQQLIERYEQAMAEADARAAVVARDIRTDARAAGPALVFSLRLNPSDYIQLKMCADRVGIGPSVLARNLIRVGLGQP